MAKKGGVQQLQAEINTDEEFERFLERPGLLVLDVYSEWCGPCLGMVGSLRKIKLELGGDQLSLAICKADTITSLKRFFKKSEPTWLFVANGRAVNLMFGTDVPKLMKLIASELKALESKSSRPTYDITEYQPEEVERRKVKEDAIAEAERIEKEQNKRKRYEYLTSVTDQIMENLPEIGVTIFGPQVNRDMFKKLMEPADLLRIQCKDRKAIPVHKVDFDVVNFACKNPISPEVLEQLYEKELFMCFWKVPEGDSVPEMLTKYAAELTKKKVIPPDDNNEEERIVPPIIAPMEYKFETELLDDEECPPLEDPDEKRKSRKSRKSTHESEEGEEGDEYDDNDEEDEEEEDEEDEGDGELKEPEYPGYDDMEPDFIADEEEEEEEGEVVEQTPKARICIRKVVFPPIWVPSNHRTHAALVYVFFRSQTNPFLPPDPVPEPPHVIMAFDAYKKGDLIDLAERHKEDIPLYGFFTSDEADEAKFIANSAAQYKQMPHSAGDKIVFKVNKAKSNTMLSLATYNPSYVSPNPVVGREEALKFFGGNYKTAEQEEAEQVEKEETKRQRKSKRASGRRSSTIRNERQPETPREDIQAAEAATTSGEETTGESGPASVEGAPPADENAAEAPPPPEGGEQPPAEDGEPPPEEAPAE